MSASFLDLAGNNPYNGNMQTLQAIWILFAILTRPVSDLRIEVEPSEPRQGQIALIRAQGAGPGCHVSGSFLGRDLRFFSDYRGRARALAAIKLDSQPGDRSLVVRIEPLGRAPFFIGRPVSVIAGDFEVQRLRVKRRFVQPPGKLTERLERESRELHAVLHSAPLPRTWQGSFCWPRRDRITADFGLERIFNGKPRGRHTGLDIDGDMGDPVHAVGAGKVVLVKRRYIGGGTIVLDHGLGLHSRYCHLSAFWVEEGLHVDRGQPIGAVGASGRVTGPHLHLATDIDGIHFDPLSLFDLDLGPADEPGSVPYPNKIATNRRLDVLEFTLDPQRYRDALREAGRKLGAWYITLGRVRFNGDDLIELASSSPNEPFLRTVREGIGRPVDLLDFIYFIDDVLAAGRWGLRGVRVWVGAGRAREAGIFVHTREVFDDLEDLLYGARGGHLEIYRPSGGPSIKPASNGAPLGVHWIGRYRGPRNRRQKLLALKKQNPVFAARVRSLIEQLENQGAQVDLWSTVRDRRRGYLIWGAYLLSRHKGRASVLRDISRLRRANRQWGLDVPIEWFHPAGIRATIRAARHMAAGYDVVFATENGARYSNHYDGEAVDLSAVDLPRRLVLEAPDGAVAVFDLSQAWHTRDLSLEPELIEWIELHFGMQKLREDYPHWNDNRLPLIPIRLASGN